MHSEGTWELRGHLGTQRATWALGHSEGTRALGNLRHAGTLAHRALRHLGTQALGYLGHLGTHSNEALGYSRHFISRTR